MRKKLMRLVALSSLVAPCAFAAAPYYTLIPIGTLGGASGDLNDLNNPGQIVGYTLSPGNVRHAYVSENGVSRSLHPNWATASHAFSINESGVSAGTVTSDNITQAVTFAGSKVNLLGSLGGANSSAVGINNAGQVAGSSFLADNHIQHAFRWSGGQMQDLGTLGGANSMAHGINNRGEVVGQADVAGGTYHAFLHSGGSMRDLGTLGGSFSSANAVNDRGQVAGVSYLAGDGTTHAFSWYNGRMADLGTLGGANSAALGLNSFGEIVGSSEVAGGGPTRAFIFTAGIMTDLNTLIDPDAEWVLRYAADINDAGQIAVLGCSEAGLLCQGFLLNPVPEPESWAMMAFGGIMVALAARRRRQPGVPARGRD
jgi:probable HAF family extracellular repeat protein